MPESRPLSPPEECANCGAAIPRGARACPECGADERTGWRETSVYDDLDLPEEAYADEKTAASGRTKKAATRVNGVPWYWWCVAVILLALLAVSWLR